jgi:predicted dehydrogenase
MSTAIETHTHLASNAASAHRASLRSERDQSKALDEPLKLGFLGLGWIGRKRLQAIATSPEFAITALADADNNCVQQALADVPTHQPLCTTSFEELLECDLDAVVIATPSALHARQAITALEHGLAVFCQKPLAITAHDTAQVIAAARANDRLLRVDYCYRHIQGMSALRERIASGALGELLSMELAFHNAYAPGKQWCFDPDLAGGGCLIDLGTHLLDLSLWLLDYPHLSFRDSHLFAQGHRLTPGDGRVEDFAVANFNLPNGAPVRLSCAWNGHVGRDASIEMLLHGTRASAVWRNVNGSFYDFEVALLHGAQQELLGQFPDDWGGRALSAFLQRLRIDNRFHSDAMGHMAGARLIDDCYQRTQPAAPSGVLA